MATDEPVIVAAPRTVPRVGDVVTVEWGKHKGKTGRVGGRLDLPGRTTWVVSSVDGVVYGDYAAEDLRIVMGG